MKKFITVLLVFTMVMSLSLAVVAAPGAFQESPSKNQAPELVESGNESEDCLARIIITAYANRDQLPEDTRKAIEDAYKIILESNVTGSLDEVLKPFADTLGIEVSDLAVSDLFDISMVGCDVHEGHGNFHIKLKADTLKNFVCLLHFCNGEIRVVKDAKVVHDGECLEFTEDEFSPFAIVVNTAAQEPITPPTGDSYMIFAVVAAVSALVLVVLVIKQKKDRA